MKNNWPDSTRHTANPDTNYRECTVLGEGSSDKCLNCQQWWAPLLQNASTVPFSLVI
jgi:hypothetical protein